VASQERDKIKLVKTRWYFRTHGPHGYAIEACVEFSVRGDGKKLASVYDYRGTMLLWSTTGVRRMDAKTARMAFAVYAEQEARKVKKPLRIG